MSANRPLVSLKEAGVSLIDCDHKTPKAQDQGLPYIGIPQLKDGRIILEGARLISEEDFKHWRRKAKPTANDVLLSRRCNPGESAFVPDGLEIALGQNLVLLRSDGAKVHPAFLRWLTQGPQWWSQVNQYLNVGAVFDSLKCADIPKFEVYLPPIEEQKSIAKVLGDLDHKILLNDQINQTLEQIAQAIFKSWFVDFEPVKAKIAALEAGGSEEDALLAAMQAISGKDEAELTRLKAEQPEQYAELRATAELFPAARQDSELGEIPEGWAALSLNSQVSALRGFSYKGKGLSDCGTPMHNLNSILEGGGYKYAGIKHYSLDFKSKFDVQAGDILVANTEQGHDHLLIGFGAAVPHFYEHGFFSHHLYRLRPKPDSHLTSQFLGHLFRHKGFVKKVQGYANGTTVNMLPLSGVEMPVVVCPGKDLVSVFSKKVTALNLQTEKNFLQSKSLLELRDILLPKLLSGELSVSDAKYQIAEATEQADV